MWTCAICGDSGLFDAPATTPDGEDAHIDCAEEAVADPLFEVTD